MCKLSVAHLAWGGVVVVIVVIAIILIIVVVVVVVVVVGLSRFQSLPAAAGMGSRSGSYGSTLPAGQHVVPRANIHIVQYMPLPLLPSLPLPLHLLAATDPSPIVSFRPLHHHHLSLVHE